MRNYLYFSLRFLVLFCVAFYPESGRGEKIVEAPMPREEIIKKVKEEYPLKDWKIIGVCGYKKEPVVHLRVPKFMNWEKDCNLYHIKKNGIEYCGPSDTTPRIEGELKFWGYLGKLEIGFEAISIKKPYDSNLDINIFDPDWGEPGAILEKKPILVDGYEAYLAEIEDVNGKLKKPTKIMTLAYFSYPFLGGHFAFIESYSKYEQSGFTPHKDRVFQWVIDNVVKSIKFEVKVEDSKNKARFRYLKPKNTKAREEPTQQK